MWVDKTDVTDRLTTISTTIPLKAYQTAKERGYKFNELLLLGLRAKEENPQLIERITVLEEGNKKLQFKITALYTELMRQEEESKNVVQR